MLLPFRHHAMRDALMWGGIAGRGQGNVTFRFSFAEDVQAQAQAQVRVQGSSSCFVFWSLVLFGVITIDSAVRVARVYT